jgi:hypothetical protein
MNAAKGGRGAAKLRSLLCVWIWEHTLTEQCELHMLMSRDAACWEDANAVARTSHLRSACKHVSLPPPGPRMKPKCVPQLRITNVDHSWTWTWSQSLIISTRLSEHSRSEGTITHLGGLVARPPMLFQMLQAFSSGIKS